MNLASVREMKQKPYLKYFLVLKKLPFAWSETLAKEEVQGIEQFEQLESSEQTKTLIRLRHELIQQIASLNIGHQTRSYWLHQVAHLHQLSAFCELLQEINQRQKDQRQALLISLGENTGAKRSGIPSLMILHS
jgi:hypothetical protein